MMTIGATTGGMLAAAFLPMAVAHADDASSYFGFTLPDNGSIVGEAGFPPLFQYASADGVSLAYDASDDHSGVLSTADFSDGGGSGSINADIDNLYFDLLGASSQTITLNEDLTIDGAGADSGDIVAGEGSVFNVTEIGLGFGNVYVDAVDAGADGSNEITDLLVTPFGTIDISGLVGDVLDFDAAAIDGSDAVDVSPGAELLGGSDIDLFGGLFGSDGLFSGDGLFGGGGGFFGGLFSGIGSAIGGENGLLGGILGGLTGEDGLLGGLTGDGGLLGGLTGDGGLLGGLLGDDGLLGGLLGGGGADSGSGDGGSGGGGSADSQTAAAIEKLLTSADGADLSTSDFQGGSVDDAAGALADGNFGDTASADEVTSALSSDGISISDSSETSPAEIADLLNAAGDSGTAGSGGGGAGGADDGGLLDGLTDGLGDILHGDIGGGLGEILGGLGDTIGDIFGF